MRSLLCLLGLTVFVAMPRTARADAYSTFNLTGVTLQTGFATGTVTFDITSGQVISANVDLYNGLSNFIFDSVGSTIPTSADVFFNLADSASDIYQLSVPLLTTVGYTGSSICTYDVRCSGFVGGYFPGGVVNGPGSDYNTAGTLTPTPEPDSIALVVTGVLAVAGFFRRGFAIA